MMQYCRRRRDPSAATYDSFPFRVRILPQLREAFRPAGRGHRITTSVISYSCGARSILLTTYSPNGALPPQYASLATQANRPASLCGSARWSKVFVPGRLTEISKGGLALYAGIKPSVGRFRRSRVAGALLSGERDDPQPRPLLLWSGIRKLAPNFCQRPRLLGSHKNACS